MYCKGPSKDEHCNLAQVTNAAVCEFVYTALNVKRKHKDYSQQTPQVSP